MLIFTQTQDIAAGVNTTVCEIDELEVGAIVNIIICKKTPGTAIIGMSVTVGEITTNYESNIPLSSGGPPLVWTREVLPGGAIVKVISDVDGVDVTVSGVTVSGVEGVA